MARHGNDVRKIKAGELPSRSGKIVATDVHAALTDRIKLSFKFLTTDHATFKYTDRDVRYFSSLLERLKQLSSLQAADFHRYMESWRNHRVDWNDSRVSMSGFSIRGHEQLDANAFQFSVSKSEHGRVVGAFIDTVFYIVWLDPQHQTYPQRG